VFDFKELTKKVDLKPGTLTPIVNKIEEIGYLVKVKNENDARKINVSLTPRGRELREDIIDVPLQLGETLNITIKEYRTLVEELDNLITKMKEV